MIEKPSYEDLAQRVKEIEQSEEKYRHLFETAMVGIYRTRIEDGKVLAANEALATMMGYEPDNPVACRHLPDYCQWRLYICQRGLAQDGRDVVK